MALLGAYTEESFARNARVGLEGDGVAARLFEILWKRDLLSDSSLALRIPDTVIFKYNAPSLWYFTSVDGTIKRKGKAKVNREHIEKEFNRRASSSGILAYYVSTEADETVGETEDTNDDEGPSEQVSKTTIEYLDREGLHEFLSGRARTRTDGILQKFVEPSGDRNNMVRALWSPKVCLLERRVNRLRLSDTRYDVYERAVTFEGPDVHSEVTPVRGNALMNKVQQVADSIVEHVAAVTHDRVRLSRIALNFKVDDRDRLWLLFASSVRLRDEMRCGGMAGQVTLNVPMEVNTSLTVPDHVRRVCSVPGRPVSLQRNCTCSTCEEKVESGGLFDVAYKVLIEFEERRPVLQQVPDVLQRLHPRLTSEEYTRLRHDVAFLHKAAAVCEACYLLFSAPQLGQSHSAPNGVTASQGAAENAEALKGTENLNPERLRQRQLATLRKISETHCRSEGVEEEMWRRKRQAESEEGQRLRAKSCPKLPTWGPTHSGPVLFPPAPVLSQRRACAASPPPPPTDGVILPPRFVALARVPSRRQLEKHPEKELARPLRVPPLRGAPYLRELQNFAANSGARAEYILPSSFAEIMPIQARRGLPGPLGAGEAVLKACSSSSTPAEVPSQGQGQSTADGNATAVEKSLSPSTSPSTSPTRQRQRPRSSSSRLGDSRSPSPPGMSAEEKAAAAAAQKVAAAAAAAAAVDAVEKAEAEAANASAGAVTSPGPAFSIAEDDDNEACVLDASLSDPNALLHLWGKWPPSCKSGAGSGATTRPPSQGGTAQTSSYPSSVPSTRTSSRLHSAAGSRGGGVTTPSRMEAALFGLQTNRRPSSSPQVSSARRNGFVAEGACGGSAAARISDEETRLRRPRSSPQLIGTSFRRPPAGGRHLPSGRIGGSDFPGSSRPSSGGGAANRSARGSSAGVSAGSQGAIENARIDICSGRNALQA
eukprot:TRINITY_DN27599_c0_g1_i1.p1 TRINITY_DN27599_c0_g1~~TRINITY_DN27599_c0_g1_i1.p1  ORF type:complete len:963 (-),score=181.19 TRINITY_DN27599_c0_g1_i1:208-3024(-)